MENPKCTYCNSETEFHDSGIFNHHVWETFKCTECGEIIGNEPDYEFLNEIKHGN